MGAPKQKWTAEEESALKAGIAKHGAGKWRTILKDPEFSGILILRSNVDLKDKWRNMCVMGTGYGSREKPKFSSKKNRHATRHGDNQLVLSTVDDDFEDEIVDVKPLAVSNDTLQIAGPKKTSPTLDNVVLEAIAKLKEPSGSNKTAIATYIEENYWPPPDLRQWLSDELNRLTATGRLIRVKRRYRIAPSTGRGKSSKMLLIEGRQKGLSRLDRNDTKPLTKSEVDAELARMMSMTAEEAATAAAQAVAEAEAAMEEAEEAARIAESLEADAEAAQAFHEAALSTLNRFSVNLNLPMLRA